MYNIRQYFRNEPVALELRNFAWELVFPCSLQLGVRILNFPFKFFGKYDLNERWQDIMCFVTEKSFLGSPMKKMCFWPNTELISLQFWLEHKKKSLQYACFWFCFSIFMQCLFLEHHQMIAPSEVLPDFSAAPQIDFLQIFQPGKIQNMTGKFRIRTPSPKEHGKSNSYAKFLSSSATGSFRKSSKQFIWSFCPKWLPNCSPICHKFTISTPP